MTDDETIAVRVTVIGGQRLDCTDSPAARRGIQLLDRFNEFPHFCSIRRLSFLSVGIDFLLNGISPIRRSRWRSLQHSGAIRPVIRDSAVSIICQAAASHRPRGRRYNLEPAAPAGGVFVV